MSRKTAIRPALLLLVLVGVGCAAPEQEAGLTAEEILARMAEVYATCETYRDTGTIQSDELPMTAVPEPESDLRFRTSFARPSRFRFEYTHPGLRTNGDSRIVWMEGEDVRAWRSRDGSVESDKSLSLAIAAATGVSEGSAHYIPRMLMHDRVSGRSLGADLRETKVIAREAVDGTSCWKLTGRLISTIRCDLWIDSASYLLRKAEMHMSGDEQTLTSTIVWHPEINVPISDEELAFNPPR